MDYRFHALYTLYTLTGLINFLRINVLQIKSPQSVQNVFEAQTSMFHKEKVSFSSEVDSYNS